MKLKGSLPKGDLNGLAPAHSQLIKARGKKVLVIGAVTSHEYTDVQDKGKEAKVELVRVEVVPDDLQPYIAELIERALEDRTGQTSLDLEIEGATDLRKEFRERKAKAGETPDLFAEPQAITAAPALAGTQEEGDVVDAEIVDEADESAREGGDVIEEREQEAEAEGIPFDQWVQQQSREVEPSEPLVDEDDEDPGDDLSMYGDLPTPSLESDGSEDTPDPASPMFSDRPSLDE